MIGLGDFRISQKPYYSSAKCSRSHQFFPLTVLWMVFDTTYNIIITVFFFNNNGFCILQSAMSDIKPKTLLSTFALSTYYCVLEMTIKSRAWNLYDFFGPGSNLVLK